MLVLTRRTEESVVIGGNIVITVLGVEGEKVKLGIDAPREVTILRSELMDAAAQPNRLADKPAPLAEPLAQDGLLDRLPENPGDPQAALPPD